MFEPRPRAAAEVAAVPAAEVAAVPTAGAQPQSQPMPSTQPQVFQNAQPQPGSQPQVLPNAQPQAFPSVQPLPGVQPQALPDVQPQAFPAAQSMPGAQPQRGTQPMPGGQPQTQVVPPGPAPRTSTAAAVLAIVGLILLGLLFLLVAAFLALALGPVAFVVCGLLALIPLAVVVTAITLIDRWEPEPRPALWFALLWGAAAAVAIALIVDLGFELAAGAAAGDPAGAGEVLGSVVQAPIVEESAKALGVLILLLVLRRQFDGPVDGLVYGATVAAGFAFTENILYFGQALVESGGVGLGFTFVLRGILSPFAHVMFTACTGVALGFAVRRRSRLAGVGLFVVGLALAIGLHALWNGSTYLAEGLGGFFLLYLVVQVPLFVLAVVFVVLLRKAERSLTRARLIEYAQAGWFTAAEVEMLSSGAARRQAQRWARTLPGDGRPAMRAFIRDATRLAFARQRLVTGRPAPAYAADEAHLLASLQHDRLALAAAATPRPR